MHHVRRETVGATLHAQSVTLHIPGIDVLFVLSWFRDDKQRFLEMAGFADQLVPGRSDQPVTTGQVVHEVW